MTTAQILRAARELMLAQRGPGCADRPFWVQVAGFLRVAEVHALTVAEAHGADVVDEHLVRPLAIANAYLDTSSIKEHAHG